MAKTKKTKKTKKTEKGKPEKTGTEEYEIGYAKPPAQTRFSSDNQPENKGRPAGSTNFKTEALKILEGMAEIAGHDLAPMGILARQLIALCVSKEVNGQEVSPAVKLNALREILDRFEGKPTVKIGGDEERPIRANIDWISSAYWAKPETEEGDSLPGRSED